MSTGTCHSELISKIKVLLKTICQDLFDKACSTTQVYLFLQRKIFVQNDQHSRQQNTNIEKNKEGTVLNTQEKCIQQCYQKLILDCLKAGKTKGQATYVTLVHILARLQTQMGAVKQLQQTENKPKTQQLSFKPYLVAPKTQVRGPTPKVAKTTVKAVLNQPKEQRLMKQLEQKRDLQQQLQEGIRKTKELKRLLEQKMMKEIEESYLERIRNIHQLLAMEGSS